MSKPKPTFVKSRPGRIAGLVLTVLAIVLIGEFWPPGPARAWTEAELLTGYPLPLGEDPVEESSVGLIEDGEGNVFIAVGDAGGRVWRIRPGGDDAGQVGAKALTEGLGPVAAPVLASPSMTEIYEPDGTGLRAPGSRMIPTAVGSGADVNDQAQGGLVLFDWQGGRVLWDKLNEDNYDGTERPEGGTTRFQIEGSADCAPADDIVIRHSQGVFTEDWSSGTISPASWTACIGQYGETPEIRYDQKVLCTNTLHPQETGVYTIQTFELSGLVVDFKLTGAMGNDIFPSAIRAGITAGGEWPADPATTPPLLDFGAYVQVSSTSNTNALISYWVNGRLEFTDSTADLNEHAYRIEVLADGRVTFYRDGAAVGTSTGRVSSLRANGPIGPAYSNGYAEGTFGAVNLTDLTNDGTPELIYGAWDHNIYIRNLSDGALFNPSWPLNVNDTVWGTPVVCDLDRDGALEVIIGSDVTPTASLDIETGGGYMHVLDLNAQEKDGWPYYGDQTFYSSPAVGDIDNDGQYEIVCGTGTYWPDKGRKVYAWDPYGRVLTGWPVTVGGYVFSSPALADLDGDNTLETIVGCHDGRIYCINHDGTIRWSTELADRDGNSYTTLGRTAAIRSSPTVADVTGDGLLNILVSFLWEVVVLDRDGRQLTGPGSPDGEVYLTYWTVLGSPAVYDIDRNGYLDIVVAGGGAGKEIRQNGALWAWTTPAPADSARPWWTFHRDARRTGFVPLGENGEAPPTDAPPAD